MVEIFTSKRVWMGVKQNKVVGCRGTPLTLFNPLKPHSSNNLVILPYLLFSPIKITTLTFTFLYSNKSNICKVIQYLFNLNPPNFNFISNLISTLLLLYPTWKQTGLHSQAVLQCRRSYQSHAGWLMNYSNPLWLWIFT